MIEISADAARLLEYFRGKQQGDYQLAKSMISLFSDVETCERAQMELATAGFLTLAPIRTLHPEHKVAAASITLDGLRWLQRAI
jgi:hypothetical protein